MALNTTNIDRIKHVTDRYQALLNSINQGFCIIEMIWDERGYPVDYLFIETNKAFENQTGIKHAEGRTMRTIEPLHEEHWFQIYGKVAALEKAVQFEQKADFLRKGTWYEVYAFPMTEASGRVAVLFNDISERKRAELLSKEFLARLEQEVSERTQALKESRELLKATLNSSKDAIQVLRAIRSDDGIIIDFYWILINKLVEDIYGDIVGKRLSQLTERLPIPRDKVLFSKCKQVAETGEMLHFEYETVREQIKFWYDITLVKLNDGVVVTVSDITERRSVELEIKKAKELYDKNIQLKLKQKELKKRQQQEIFMTTLRTQEEERKRIAENLHNGLGQLLYSVKLSLEQIDIQENGQQKILQQAQHLLAAAIRESRRISHELMPSILEDFGLQVAIQDVCDQFNKSLAFKCDFIGLPYKMDKYIEIAIYRIVQELVINIIKHAKATEASVKIMLEQNAINIMVKDNGMGFDPNVKEKRGIGLNTIQDKVKLLNGSFDVISERSRGTTINIKFPNQ
ncbi:PAS domain-containing protein [Olivibacter sp. SDN3]|uniref:PAS domain-containing sensor histidine kinase n=1 Tax=Olivibacter sp. SDN3 TaxID=2764720 RepID=UPI001650D9F1|nr:ATP-binding protein [Olivibacter sp. SDN3]QNL49021.1 PAS domain-containing protein [Olivibacter sp. SDN3]